nr:T9SS sorting signal type C domain-containing protein [uncultured Flavobacterium sp.]
MIKKLLCTLFLVLVQTVVFSQKTYNVTSGNWNIANNWTPSGVPTSTDDVIIPSGKTVTIDVNAEAKSISVIGKLTLNTTLKLIVYGNFEVVAGTTEPPSVPAGNFKIIENGNSSTTLIVLGNYTNNGTTDFDKGDVIIVGDLTTPSTSTLQNLGNVIVGGNIIGDFNLQGSIQANQQIYAVNPNATVAITPTTIDADVVPGTQVTTNTETSALVALVNQYVYGGTCPFTISNIANISTCSGSNAIFTVTTTASSPTYLWQVNTNGSGWVDLANSVSYSGVTSSTLTITAVTTGMNNYKYRAKITGGSPSCVKNGNYAVLTVNNALSQPTLSTPIHLTCTSLTGSFTITNYNASYVYAVSPSIGVTISGNTVTAPAGSYTLTATLGTCISIPSSSVTINNPVTTTWNGTSWSNGIPVGGSNIVFAGSYPPAIDPALDLSGCSCQIIGSAVVTIKSGRTLTVVNELNVAGNASLIFQNNASLLQTNDAASNNIGSITYMRSNSTTRETDYTYWSSPVTGQILKNVSIKTPSDFFYSFNAVVDDWNQEDSANTMTIGLGYIIRGPHYETIPPPGFYEAPFQGVPNNGPIYVTIPSLGRETSNLIGNPYPSALNADLFLTTNSSVLDGTLYFWTHNTAMGIGVSNPGTGVYAYSSDDYATYNLTGGTATRIGNFVGGVEQASNKPNGKIAAGQGFFATGKVAGGDVIFNNSMRISGGALGVNNSQFFRTAKSSKTTNAIEKHRVWLNLTNSEGAFKQMLVGYVTDATNDYDDAFDGESFDGNQFVDFYSINDDKNLTIQGRALPFDKNDEVVLGYSSTIAGTFSISIDQVDGILTSEDVFIEDKMTNSVKNLKEGAYSFSTGVGAFNDRFVLLFTQKTLGTDNVGEFDNSVLISKDKNELKIKSELESIKRITVFDLLGRKIFDKEAVNSNEFRTSNITLNKQLVVVKVILANGKEISKKVIY